jgi:hypothetical protein
MVRLFRTPPLVLLWPSFGPPFFGTFGFLAPFPVHFSVPANDGRVGRCVPGRMLCSCSRVTAAPMCTICTLHGMGNECIQRGAVGHAAAGSPSRARPVPSCEPSSPLLQVFELRIAGRRQRRDLPLCCAVCSKCNHRQVAGRAWCATGKASKSGACVACARGE